MRELRQFTLYIAGVVAVVSLFALGTLYGAVEAVQFVPDNVASNAVVASTEGRKEREDQTPDRVRSADGAPVWIAPTPKYDYDPKLMVVKTREERLREAELRRRQEAMRHQAQKVVKQPRLQARRAIPLRQSATAYAFQPESRPVFGFFPFLR